MKFEYLTDSNTYFRFIHVPTWTGRLQIYTDSGTPISELDRLEFTDFRVRPTRACRLQRLQSKTDSGTPTSELDRLGHRLQSPMSDQPSGSQSGKQDGDDSQRGATACVQQKVSVSAFEAMKAMQEQGHTEMFAVSPLRWCPHLETVKPIPDDGIDTGLPCETCGDASENWICLVCYKVYCSRFVQEHMLMHGLETQHLMCLSFSDLSVWCYGCDHYIDNEVSYMYVTVHDVEAQYLILLYKYSSIDLSDGPLYKDKEMSNIHILSLILV
ncbi:hypothetical protein FSP39_019032 [Pinctada imbricata]|uniref:UBP-type domain-containing protein n=1 Tax=Pinctada imbricata TaxID=66713 RepID=A0AA89BTB6_PINIB|nr:hypothetical protein FSP39_019032 [Pinctada imbricata]